MPALSLALALALGQLPPPRLAQPDARATLEAQRAELDSEAHRLTAEGEVTLHSGDLWLRADTLEYDTEARSGRAEGSVVLGDGNLVIAGRAATFSLLSERELTLEGAELFQKAPDERPTSAQAHDRASAHDVGHNVLLLRAEELTRLQARHLVAKSMQMTSCDCKDKAPDWSIRASSADLVLGERALLYWPVFYVKRVPVLPLPLMYVPLTGRRTGFLLPRPGLKLGSGGFNIDEPFFLTLGPSWDLTFEAGYRFGTAESPGVHAATRGPRGAVELRWAPTETTSGHLKVVGVDDRHHDSSVFCTQLDAVSGRCLASQTSFLDHPRGFRGELRGAHSTDVGDLAALRADLALVTDRNLLSDEPMDAVVNPSLPYARSIAFAASRAKGWLAGATGTYYQDLNAFSPDPAAAVVGGAPYFACPPTSPGCEHARSDTRLIGSGAPVTLQRPGLLFLDLPRTSLAPGLEGGVEASLARFQPFTLLAGPAPGELLSRTRAQATASLAWTPLAEGPLRGEVYGWARADGSSYGGGDPALVPSAEGHARGALGAFLGTEVSRVYGGTWRHTVAPRLEVRALTQRLGSAPGGQPACFPSSTLAGVVPRDEYDLLTPQPCVLPAAGGASPVETALPLAVAAGPEIQAVVSAETRLFKKGVGEVARLQLGQDLDLRSGQASDTFGQLDLHLGRASVSAYGRYDQALRRLASAGVQAGVSDARGDSVSAGWDWLLGTLNDRLRASADELFGPRAVPSSLEGTFDLGQLGSSDALNANLALVPIKGVTLRYSTTVKLLGKGQHFLQHGAGVALGSACAECWRFELSFSYAPPANGFSLANVNGPHYLLELKGLGSFGG